MRLVREMVASAVRMGARKVFILNGHGGNDVPIRAAMREMKSDHPEVRVVFSSYWQLGAKVIKEVRVSEMGGLGHACEMETAMMLHLHPDRVRMDLRGGMGRGFRMCIGRRTCSLRGRCIL